MLHANVGIPFGPLKYIIATPQYHHWHHSSDQTAIDTNYAVHTPLFDRLFSACHIPTAHWPARYGTTKPLPYLLVDYCTCFDLNRVETEGGSAGDYVVTQG